MVWIGVKHDGLKADIGELVKITKFVEVVGGDLHRHMGQAIQWMVSPCGGAVLNRGQELAGFRALDQPAMTLYQIG